MPEFLETTVDKFTFRVATDRLYSRDGLWVQPQGGSRALRAVVVAIFPPLYIGRAICLPNGQQAKQWLPSLPWLPSVAESAGSSGIDAKSVITTWPRHRRGRDHGSHGGMFLIGKQNVVSFSSSFRILKARRM